MFPWGASPFDRSTVNKLQKMKPEEIEKYVYDVMEKMIPQKMNFGMGAGEQDEHASHEDGNEKFQHTIFETHHYIFVIIPIKDKDLLKDCKVTHTSNLLYIEHIPEYMDKHCLTLPCIVKKKGTLANFQDGTLEIKLQKNIDTQYSEISIHHNE